MIAAALLWLALQTPADPELRRELMAMEKEEQAPFREKAFTALNQADWERIGKIREKNSARLAEIVAKHGWPGSRLVGPEGANAAFLVAQHTDHDLPLQRRFLEALRRAFDARDAAGVDLAYLTDRVLSNEGKKQIYGTQTEQGPDGKYHAKPVEDPKNLDKRRKSVGLGSERSYLKTVERVSKRPLK